MTVFERQRLFFSDTYYSKLSKSPFSVDGISSGLLPFISGQTNIKNNSQQILKKSAFFFFNNCLNMFKFSKCICVLCKSLRQCLQITFLPQLVLVCMLLYAVQSILVWALKKDTVSFHGHLEFCIGNRNRHLNLFYEYTISNFCGRALIAEEVLKLTVRCCVNRKDKRNPFGLRCF